MQEMKFDGRTFNKTGYYIFKEGSLFRNVVAGQFKENRRPYRVAGNFNFYIDSFPNASLPYSKYYIANKITGDVFEAEVLQGMSDEKTYIKNLVEFLKEV